MHIAVLDGYTLNPGDLSWSALEQLGTTTIHDRTPSDMILSRAADAELVLTNKTPLTAETIAGLPKLRYIGVLATGYNVVDTDAARSHGITVTNIPSYGTASVAQMTFALLLALCHRAEHHSARVCDGAWSGNADFCFWDTPLTELCGKTLGIIGFGRIGQSVAKIAYTFGMNVVAYNANRMSAYSHPQFEWVDLNKLLTTADAVSLHCPLVPETSGIINAENLRLMKSSAFLINTSRGPLIDEAALATALNNGTIAGAALDVLSTEPPSPDNPLLTARNCIITPHIAWASYEARSRLMDTAVANVAAFLNGTPQNIV